MSWTNVLSDEEIASAKKLRQIAYRAAYYVANKDKINARNKKWKEKNPEKAALIKKNWDNKNPDKVKQNQKNSHQRRSAELTQKSKLKWNSKTNEEKLSASRAVAQWRLDNPDRQKNIRLKHHYGITIEKFNALFVKQGNCCAICKSESSKSKKDWCVDHDHKTWKIRGLLCHKCNIAIGNFEDSITYLQSAIIYLERAK